MLNETSTVSNCEGTKTVTLRTKPQNHILKHNACICGSMKFIKHCPPRKFAKIKRSPLKTMQHRRNFTGKITVDLRPIVITQVHVPRVPFSHTESLSVQLHLTWWEGSDMVLHRFTIYLSSGPPKSSSEVSSVTFWWTVTWVMLLSAGSTRSFSG